MRKLALFVAVLLAVAGCAPQASAPAPAEPVGGGTLRIGMRVEMDILDPHVLRDQFIAVHMRNAYEPLVDISVKGDVEPVLATSWEISPDAKTYTFKLRQGVKFADGTPFDAEAAKFSIDRMMRLKKGNFQFVSPVKTVEAVDPSTLRFTLNEPNATFLRGLWLIWFVSPTAAKANAAADDSQAWLNSHSVGTGAYQIESISKGSETVLGRNEHYWGGWKGPHFDKVSLKTISEPATQRLQLERGDLDISLLFTSDTLQAYKNNKDIVLTGGAISDQQFIQLQMKGDGPTTKKEVRQALNYLWDSESFAAVTNGVFGASPGPLSKPLQDGFGISTPSPYKYDPAKAKELLAKAGYPNGQGLNLKFELFQPDTTKKAMAELYQQTLAKNGIKMEIETLEFAAVRKILVDYATTGSPALRRDLFAFTILSRTGDPREQMTLLYHSKSQAGAGNNYMNYSNPQVDKLIDDALRTTNNDDAKRWVKQATDIIIDEAPAVFAASGVAVIPFRKEIRGYTHRPLLFELIRYHELYR
jgi:peptide/nickel transport system substrate-binding protein